MPRRDPLPDQSGPICERCGYPRGTRDDCPACAGGAPEEFRDAPRRRIVGQAHIRLPIEVMPQPDGAGFLAHIEGDWHHGDTEADAVMAAYSAVAHIATVQFGEEMQRAIAHVDLARLRSANWNATRLRAATRGGNGDVLEWLNAPADELRDGDGAASGQRARPVTSTLRRATMANVGAVFSTSGGQPPDPKRVALLRKLASCASDADTESAHADADRALVEYIDDPEITAAYDAVDKWYA